MSKDSSMNLRMTVYAALFTALIIIGGYLSVPIPVGPVPIVLADFFVMVTGLFLGKKWGLSSVVLYIFLGAIGLPVYASGKAGLAVLFGPTGGFLFGYLALVFAIGFISGMGKPSLLKNMTALIIGNIFLYVFGVPWLKVVMHLTWGKALAAGLIPFIPGIIIKIIVALALAQILMPQFKRTITPTQQS
ncbi:MAG: biotin transporter BioY [Anaerocolumna sp.]